MRHLPLTVTVTLTLVGLASACKLMQVNGRPVGGASEPARSSGGDGAATNGSSAGATASAAKGDADAFPRFQRLLKEVWTFRAAGDAAIPDEKLEALTATVDALAANPGAAYRQGLLARLQLYNAWFDADPPKAIAGLLGGDLVVGGATKGKTPQVSFKAKKGWCYSLKTRWTAYASGGTKVKKLSWGSGAGITPLQRYEVFEPVPAEHTWGLCAAKAGTITAKLELVFAGSQNGLQYAVVAWPKEKFPAVEAAYMRLTPGDPCDIQGWAELWTDPVPGTLVYYKGEPHLLLEVDGPDQSWSTLKNLAYVDVRARKQELTARPTGATKFTTKWRFTRCWMTEPEGPDSTKLAKCVKAVSKKYDAAWDDAAGDKANATGSVSRDEADRRVRRIEDANEKEVVAKCGKFEEPIKKRSQATFEKLVDALADAPAQVGVDRVGVLQDEMSAFD